MISCFELFKIGIGPSSSHTVGPMVAARRFLDELAAIGRLGDISRLGVTLKGALAWTGKGHATDTAVILGLIGERPDTVDPDAVAGLIDGVASRRAVKLAGGREIGFDPEQDIVFDRKTAPGRHPNSMTLAAYDAGGGVIIARNYYSIGGGFVAGDTDDGGPAASAAPVLPFPFASGDELIEIGRRTGLTIAEIVLANERALRPLDEVRAGLARLRQVMMASIDRGLTQDGILPGGLKVRRRARGLKQRLEADHHRNDVHPHEVMDWVSLYAIAVNEENAAGGRVVTAPTNGAAGIIPAVLRYFRDHCRAASAEAEDAFLLTATGIGQIIKLNASISGAEVGCQGEVGSAAAMAAAGLATALGATNDEIENAAEIAMEHHLGMTCDPVGGLVQIPCIERNAFGAIKAIAAASLAMRGDGVHHVSFDQVIKTMRETGADMNEKYKETSQGGLAVNVVAC